MWCLFVVLWCDGVVSWFEVRWLGDFLVVTLFGLGWVYVCFVLLEVFVWNVCVAGNCVVTFWGALVWILVCC